MLFQRDDPTIEDWVKHPDEDKYRHRTFVSRQHLEGPDEVTGFLGEFGWAF